MPSGNASGFLQHSAKLNSVHNLHHFVGYKFAHSGGPCNSAQK
jgi:hypothetical protein